MNANVRTQLAEAANTVYEVNAQPYFVQTTKPGATLIRLNRVEYPNPFGGVAFWDVVVVLPQDLAAAERYVEQVVPQVRDALLEVMFVDVITPQLMDFGAGSVPCAVITGHREEDN